VTDGEVEGDGGCGCSEAGRASEPRAGLFSLAGLAAIFLRRRRKAS
jgi:MYXO-CTERM domain-containing protein